MNLRRVVYPAIAYPMRRAIFLLAASQSMAAGVIGGFLISWCSGTLYAQIGAPEVTYFLTTEDFTAGREGEEAVIPIITYDTPEFIGIPKWIDTSTGKRSKNVVYPWAVRYHDEIYITLRYSIEYYNPAIYIKPDVLGRYCVLTLNKSTPRAIKNGGQNYGTGAQGVLLRDMDKWGNSWKSEDGEKNKILIADTHKIYLWFVQEVRSASWKLLDKKNFNEILDLTYTNEQIESLAWEQVIQAISQKNGVE